jgi:hypothetical protein
MAHAKVRKSETTRCSTCGREAPNYDIISLGSIENGYRELCAHCFNTDAAELEGLDSFEHPDFKPVRIVDCEGQPHDFHFRTYLFGPGVALDAFEVRDGTPGGYEFQIIGEPQDDLMVLLGRLIQKIRRALAIKHLGVGPLGLRIADPVVRGRIEWDEDERGQAPLLVIDGREITWEQFGLMMMTFEGSQFRMEIRDMSEEP